MSKLRIISNIEEDPGDDSYSSTGPVKDAGKVEIDKIAQYYLDGDIDAVKAALRDKPALVAVGLAFEVYAEFLSRNLNGDAEGFLYLLRW